MKEDDRFPLGVGTAAGLRRAGSIARALLRYWAGGARAAPPLQVYFLVSDLCNLRCRMCRWWEWEKRREEPAPVMSTSEIRALFDACRELRVPTLVLSGGEPLLRPDFEEIARAAAPSFPYVRLQTNGWLLEEHADLIVDAPFSELWVSMDGLPETHDAIRGRTGSFERLARGLRMVAERKAARRMRTPEITVQMTVLPENLGEVVPVARMAVDLGASRVGVVRVADMRDEARKQTEEVLSETCSTPQFSSGLTAGSSPLVLSTEARKALEALERRSSAAIHVDPILVRPARFRPVERCLLPWTMMLVSPAGEVRFCHGMDALACGSVRDEGARAAWNGPRIGRLRRAARAGLPVCAECCVPRRTLRDHLRNPENFRRLFPRGARAPSGDGNGN